jgi:hypothetical protein
MMLRCLYSQPVPRRLVVEDIEKWLCELYSKDDFVVEPGEDTETEIVVPFLGQVKTASTRAQQAIASLVLGRGRYRCITSKIPGRAGPIEVHPFVNFDKNMATLRREAAGRKLKSLVAPLLPEGQRVWFDPDNGILSHNWQHLARFNWSEIDSLQAIEWRADKAQSLKTDLMPDCRS